jgi:hypothetical protein
VTRHRFIHLAVLSIALAGALSSCGGSGAPSKAEFAQKADKICADVENKVTALNQSKPQNLNDLSKLITGLKTTVNDGITRLQSLDRPNGQAGDTAQKFTDTLDQQYKNEILPALTELEKAIQARDAAALRAASKKLQTIKDTEANRLAGELGAQTCAKPG